MGFVGGATFTVGGLYIVWIALIGVYFDSFILTEHAQAQITAKVATEEPQRFVLHYEFHATDEMTFIDQVNVSWGQFERANVGAFRLVVFDPPAPKTHRFVRKENYSPLIVLAFLA
jgi:hypothetical protein